MIEVTCAACGTLNRIAEGDVSPGAKFVTCTSCKSRVALPMKAPTAAIPKVPPIPTAPIPKMPPPIPSAGPKKPGAVDLADLPAPKRTSPLATLADSKPAPRSALAEADLPAPKMQAKGGGAPMDLDDIMPGGDLPAPKAKGITDLPAPKSKTGPVPRPPAADLGIADLPAPKARAAMPKMPAGNALDDDILDLPKPKGPPNEIVDLPAPKGITDLPAPKGITDLPMPKPGANGDLPAPKGFFDDLPQPAKGGGKGSIDLPAPKGFFDDLPQPAKPNKPELPAPKGFFDDLPQPAKPSKPELPAPKGFFDDLPQPAAQKPGGVFDDFPEPSKSGPPLELDSLELDAPSLHGGKPLELADSAGPALGDRSQSGTFDLAGGGGFKDLDLAEPTKPPVRINESPIKIKAKADGATPQTQIGQKLADKKKSEGLELALEDEPRSAIKERA